MIFLKCSNTVRLFIFMMLLIFSWMINLVLPVHTNFPLIYPVRLTFVWYCLLIFYAVYIIYKKNVRSSNDITLGIVLGAVAGNRDIFIALSTALAYISSKSIMRESFDKNHSDVNADKYSKLIVLLVLVCWVIFNIQASRYDTVLVVHLLYRSIMPSFSEEIIFRMFIFAFTINIVGRNLELKNVVLCVFMMSLPFALLHEPRNFNGFEFSIDYYNLVSIITISFILSLLFLKTGLFITILMHLAIGFIGSVQNLAQYTCDYLIENE